MSHRVKILDTTLRDGEQSPGCSMNENEKLKIAFQLERLKVDIIEAGFAASSPGDFRSVKLIADNIKDCAITSLSRTKEADILASWEALKNAEKPILHLVVASSPIHRQYKMRNISKEKLLEQITSAVKFASGLTPFVEFSAEDATRTEPDFLCEVVRTALKAGATTVNIPDTVGYTTPFEMYELISLIRREVPEIEAADLSVHCHNDLGMAVANTLAAVRAGATQVECTINGIGERAGNCSLEEVVMALKTRGEFLGAYTGVDSTQIYRTSKMLSSITGVSVPPNKAIVGRNAFAHEAGIHQHGVLLNPLTYEIMRPETIGISQNNMVLGKHSGKHAFADRLAELGYDLTKDEISAAFESFKALCDRKKEVTDYDIEALLDNQTHTYQFYKLKNYVVNSGNEINSTVVITLDNEGSLKTDVSMGEGPIDAAYNAIGRISGLELHLDDYKINSVGKGEDALGEVSVRVRCNDISVTGRGVSPDIIESSILAYLHAVNKLLLHGGKTA